MGVPSDWTMRQRDIPPVELFSGRRRAPCNFFFFWTLDLSCQRKHVSYTRLKAQEDYRILLRTYVIIDYIERLSLHLIFVYIQMILVYES